MVLDMNVFHSLVIHLMSYQMCCTLIVAVNNNPKSQSKPPSQIYSLIASVDIVYFTPVVNKTTTTALFSRLHNPQN